MTQRKPNKFADLISAARETDEPESPAVPPEPMPLRDRTTHAAPTARDMPQELSAEPPRRGRPPTGKRSDPGFEQVTAYIRKDTYLQTKIALLQEGNTRDFSDLVETLLQQWLRKQS